MGLHLNEDKVFAVAAPRYKGWLDAPDQRWQEISDEVEFDLSTFNIYGDVVEEPDDADLVVQAAERALNFWSNSTATFDQRRGLDGLINRRLATQALGYLSHLRSPLGLSYVEDLVAREPSMTSKIGEYLGLTTSEHPGETASTFDALVSNKSLYLSAWQCLWLLEQPIAAIEASEKTITWIRSVYSSPSNPDVLRSRAALVLAMYGRLDSAKAMELMRTVHPASIPDAGLALAYAVDENELGLRDAVARESPLLRWIMEYATNEIAAF